SFHDYDTQGHAYLIPYSSSGGGDGVHATSAFAPVRRSAVARKVKRARKKVLLSAEDDGGYQVASSDYQESYGHPYIFSYAVNDGYGNNHGRTEESDGKTVKGSYSVLLPNGLKQTVAYIADEYGYRADVSYHHADGDDSD
ncbi:unnamed protein product, partial [Darwinula stevensoni]